MFSIWSISADGFVSREREWAKKTNPPLWVSSSTTITNPIPPILTTEPSKASLIILPSDSLSLLARLVSPTPTILLNISTMLTAIKLYPVTSSFSIFSHLLIWCQIFLLLLVRCLRSHAFPLTWTTDLCCYVKCL